MRYYSAKNLRTTMINLSLVSLADILNIKISNQHGSINFNGISIDTRTIQPDNLFVALKGENHDSHSFLDEAQKKGAVAALVNRQMPAALPQIIVADTIKALGQLAHFWRNQFSIPLVGLTGSNGKTTLKNMIASILRAACEDNDAVLATKGNLNNHIGVPLMLCQLNALHRYAVIEMGTNHFGEIAYLTNLVHPSVAIINNAAPAHLQGLSSVEGVAKAKGEIFLGLAHNGVAVLNKDDAHFLYWKGLIGKHAHLTFGSSSSADVYANIHDSNNPLQQRITIITPVDRLDITLPLLGRHNVMNAVAAAAACTTLHIDGEAIKKGLENIQPEKGRLQMHTFSNDIRLIDDTYNANPVSLQAAVNVLATFSGKRILVLGDMKELGDTAAELHANMGTNIRQAGIEHLFTYGEFSAEVGKNFGNDSAHHFQDKASLVDAVKKYVQPNTVLLVKGSRKMKMENVVDALKESLAS